MDGTSQNPDITKESGESGLPSGHVWVIVTCTIAGFCIVLGAIYAFLYYKKIQPHKKWLARQGTSSTWRTEEPEGYPEEERRERSRSPYWWMWFHKRRTGGADQQDGGQKKKGKKQKRHIEERHNEVFSDSSM